MWYSFYIYIEEEKTMGLFNKKELRRIEELENELKETKSKLDEQKLKNEKFGIYKYEDALGKIQKEQNEHKDVIQGYTMRIDLLYKKFDDIKEALSTAKASLANTNEKLEKATKSLENQKKKVAQGKELCKALINAYKYEKEDINLQPSEEYAPTVITQLQCLAYQDLRKEYRQNEKNINEVLKKYESRYTTKANKAIYTLMVIALQAELQNILSNMKYDKLDIAIAQVNEMCDKYNMIADDGSQTIASTLKRFIGEIKYLFENAVKIEYEYYIKKEREKAEQAAIREQMRQESEERRQLAQQKEQVKREESKYLTEIENVKAQINETNDNEQLIKLQQKIRDLQSKLCQVQEKKEEIINRQNGKAGNVYVISNLGSFGENVFKVGMTRRLDPMDRVRELSDASVPFSFDVHAMIFSEDAVSLENKLHQILDKHRVNKVNLRKEFFNVTIEEIEHIVIQEDPAASFNRTMIAEQYRQSLSMADNTYL